jgi:hypothetical protein
VTTIPEGQETSKDDSHKDRKRRGGGAVPGAAGGVLDSPVAIAIGVGALAGVGAWVYLHGDEPLSPKK